MNKAQIKAELRRSALEDKNWSKSPAEAFDVVVGFMWQDEMIPSMNIQFRTFFLLVAEAL